MPVISSGGQSGWHDKSIADGPGVVLGRATNLGKPYWVEGPYWPLNTTLYVRDFKGNEPRFIFHLFESLDLTRFDSGSVQPMLNRNYIANVPVYLPSLDEQRRIAGVLGALDDLIDTNQSLASKAGDLAVALAGTASGQVPLSTLSQLANTQQFRPHGLIDHYSIPIFDELRLPERIDGLAVKSGKLRITEPSVLVSRLNPQTPRVWMAYTGDVPAATSTEFVVLHANVRATVEEVWALCACDDFAAQMQSRVTGTTGSHQRVDKAAIPTLLVADLATVDPAARTAIVALVQEAQASLLAARDATATRDALLPLLLSRLVQVNPSKSVGV